jgi:hypothetical protein
MASNPTSLGRDSPPPPRPPPKQRGPGLPSHPAVSKITPQPPAATTNPSPVRRKPLPQNAFSPPLPPIQTAQPSTQIFGQVIQHLANRGRTESPQQPLQSPEDLSLDKQTPTHQDPPADPSTEPLPPPQSYNTLTRELSHPESLTKSSSNGALPRVSSEQSPERSRYSDTVTFYADGPGPEAAIAEEDEEEDEMALKPGARPPPVRTDTANSTKSLGVDQKKPQTPGSKFTSFFTRKQTASPGTESIYTESDQGKSPLPSPYPNSEHPSNTSAKDYGFPSRAPTSQSSKDSIDFDASAYMQAPTIPDRSAALEAELREISKELAGSIKREMDLEDLVERLQAEGPAAVNAADRTSDYFSDSGTSSIRPNTSDYSPKEEMERVKRDAEQQRAQMKVEFSNKWQREMATRKAMESHLQYMEQRHSDARGQINSSTDASTKAERLEAQLKDLKRQLVEERQTKDNFQDLLGALQGDLEQHRNQRDNLRDEVVPQLKSTIEGLEATLADAQKSPYDVARMQHELQSLRDENAALHSARMMNAQFESIAEEDGAGASGGSFFGMRNGLQRTGTLGRSNSRAGMTRSNSISKKNLPTESPQQLADMLKAMEQQRDALHNTVKYLLRRQALQTKQYEKRLKVADIERERSNSFTSLTRPIMKKGGFEREVRGLRAEINLLRKRADDALEQKWQCEKGLAGLKMDLDRSKQETESLQRLLQARDGNSPEFLSTSLEKALQQLNQRQNTASLSSLDTEQQLSDQLEQSADQIRKQLKTNTALRNRLKEAIEKGERDQAASADQINDLQGKLRKLEDTITSAQLQSETAVLKHEEDIRVLRASTNMHLLRANSVNRASGILSAPRSPLSPMLSNSKKSPRLDKTTSGPGMALSEALKTEFLEKKVEELEAALAEAEREMGEVVGRMNGAQMGVAELEGER